MQQVDEVRLESDLEYRYQFLAEFIGFGDDDVAAFRAFAPHLGPRINELVEETYRKLLSYSATARHFVPRQTGFEGEPPVDLSQLNVDHPQIRFRKDHLQRYFLQLIGRSYDAKMIQYFDMVGKIHTPKAGNKEINVPLVQMNALIGLMSDILLEFIGESPLEKAAALKTQRAFNKLLWVQNDFVQRHYVAESA